MKHIYKQCVHYSSSKSHLFPTKVNESFGFPFCLASSNHFWILSKLYRLTIEIFLKLDTWLHRRQQSPQLLTYSMILWSIWMTLIQPYIVKQIKIYCVPYLQFDVEPIQLDHSSSKLYADSDFMLLPESLVNELHQQTRFANTFFFLLNKNKHFSDTSIPNNDELEEVTKRHIKIKIFMFRAFFFGIRLFWYFPSIKNH